MSSVSAALNSVLSPDMATIVNIEDIFQQIQTSICKQWDTCDGNIVK